MNRRLVNRDLGFFRATLVGPTRRGCLYAAHAVQPSLLPVLLPSAAPTRAVFVASDRASAVSATAVNVTCGLVVDCRR